MTLNKTHFVYLSIIVGLGLIICILLNEWNKSIKQNDYKDSVIAEKNSQIEYRKNSEGRVVAEKNAALVDLKNFKESYPKLVEDINKKLDIKTKNIMAALQANFSAHGSGKVTIMRDTITLESGAKEQRYQVNIDDGYLNLEGETIDGTSAKYKYTYSDTLLLAFEKKKSFFKGETLKVSGVLSNPNAHITHFTGALIHQVKPRRFNISVGVYYDPFSQRFGPAVTAGYSILRF